MAARLSKRPPCDFSAHVCTPCTAEVCKGECHQCQCCRCGVSHKKQPLYGDGEDGESICAACDKEL